MKNIFLKQIMIITVGFLTIFSCDYDPTQYDALTDHAPDPNAAFYVQLNNNSLSAEVGRDENDNPVNVEEEIVVELMGLPQNEAVTASLSHDAASTMTPDMYTLSSSSVTIPAGANFATIDFSTVAENMPECEYVTLILNMDAGSYTTTSDPGKKLTYTIRKISPSPLENGLSDLAGTWGISKSSWKYTTSSGDLEEANFSATWDGTNLIAKGLGENMIVNFWGEPVVSGGTTTMTVTEDGTITIPRQYIFTTVYPPPAGANYDYEIEGSGTWVSLCGEPPVIKLQYDIYYPGDECGLACVYKGLIGSESFGGVFILN